MNISFWLALLFTDTLDAEEFTVLGLKIEKFPSCFFMSFIDDVFSSMTSLAMRGFMCEVLVS